ncbi:hypothetical protein GFJ91_17655, partial [Salmonella enterica subsp. enterica serovar Enteritidis]|nr:hypothetical protein [Salmonella enterica subsp. enterica serovar Enteritidis]
IDSAKKAGDISLVSSVDYETTGSYPLKPDIFPMPCFYNLCILSAMRTLRLKKSSRALAALTFFGWTP